MSTALDDLTARACRAVACLLEQNAVVSELAQGLASLPRTAEADPSAALVRVRKTLQFVVDRAYERAFDEPPGTRPLENLLQRLAKEGNFPRRLAAFAGLVRDLGNVGAHTFGEHVTAADVERALGQLVPILEWHAGMVDGDAGRTGEPARQVEQISEKPSPRPAARPRYHFHLLLLFLVVSLAGIGWYLAHKDDTPKQPTEDPPVLPARAEGLPASSVLRLLTEGPFPDGDVARRIELRMDLQWRAGASNPWKPLPDGEPLSSTEDYRMEITADQTGFLYVFQIDSHGKSTCLFPKMAGCVHSEGTNPISNAQRVVVPESSQGLYLDNELGIEHVYVVLAIQRWERLETVLTAAETKPVVEKNTQPIREPFLLELRGVGGRRLGDAQGGTQLQAAYVAHNSRGMVVERWFRHVAPQR